MICSKTKSKAKLEDCAVSWSGDSLSVCSKCKWNRTKGIKILTK